jgi:hypothetical protein
MSMHRAGDGRSGIGAAAMQLMGTGEYGMSERAARVGINGALRRGLHAGPCAQKALDRIEIGFVCGGRVGRDLESEGIFESHRAGPSVFFGVVGSAAQRRSGSQPVRQASTADAQTPAPSS